MNDCGYDTATDPRGACCMAPPPDPLPKGHSEASLHMSGPAVRARILRAALSPLTAAGFALVVFAEPLRAQAVDVTTAICTAPPPDSSTSLLDVARAEIELGEVCHDAAAFDRALSELSPAQYGRSSPAEAWYLAGRAKFGLAQLGETARVRPHHIIGHSYAEGAVVALRRALERDSSHVAAAALLANPELRRLARESGGEDLALVRQAIGFAPSDAALLLRWTQLELRQGEADSAVAASGRLLEAGGDSALALLLQARGLLALGRVADGYDSWMLGLARTRDFAGRAAYREDVAWIATDVELATFDSLGPMGLADWGEAFWRRRAASAFRSVAERLAEHERRIRFALDEFALRNDERDYNKVMPYRSLQETVDDRGVVYVRHGAPSVILKSGREVVDGCPIYSWLYDAGPDKGLSVHFRPWFTLLRSSIRFCAHADFKLVPGGAWIDANAVKLAQHDTVYANWLADWRPIHGRRRERAIVQESVDRLTLAVTTDAQPHHFTRDLDARVRSYGVALPSRLVVAYGVPSTALTAVDVRGRQAFPVRLQVAALPEDGGAPVTLDTTQFFDASRQLRPDQWVVGYLELECPPGEYEVRALMTSADPEAGSFSLDVPVEVPSLWTGEAAVSALMLGTLATELRWPAPGGAFPLGALHAYRQSGNLEMLLLVDGLPLNRAVDVRIRIAPASDPDDEVLELRSTEQASGAQLVLRRSIGLSRVDPGRYMLTAEIRPEEGERFSRTQRFTVAEP